MLHGHYICYIYIITTTPVTEIVLLLCPSELYDPQELEAALFLQLGDAWAADCVREEVEAGKKAMGMGRLGPWIDW